MSDENALAIVFRTSQYAEAVMLCSMLGAARIPAEMLGANQSGMIIGGGGELLAIRIVVPASFEAEAVALIEAHMKAIGFEPHADAPASEGADSLLPCPNCEKVGLTLHAQCPGCGFEIRPAPLDQPALVKDQAAGARSFCPECRDPFTFPSGKCPACHEELEPLESGDRLCPSLTHVLYRDTAGGFVCKACERVWIELPA